MASAFRRHRLRVLALFLCMMPWSPRKQCVMPELHLTMSHDVSGGEGRSSSALREHIDQLTREAFELRRGLTQQARLVKLADAVQEDQGCDGCHHLLACQTALLKALSCSVIDCLVSVHTHHHLFDCTGKSGVHACR